MSEIPHTFGHIPKKLPRLVDICHDLPALKQFLEKEKGFTLIEIMVVIVILGILAGIAIGLTHGLKEKASISFITSDLTQACKTSLACFSDNPRDEIDLLDLDAKGFGTSVDAQIIVADGNRETLRLKATHPKVVRVYKVDHIGGISKQ
jgi:prepilin-type N-terminal cleavage/methylation domain-containing protein